jgi:DNA-binding transcriptional ArsR family regulator
MNMTKSPADLEKVSDLLQVISPTPRLEILLGIGAGEACVCHLEAMFGLRQAALSQHLMALREAGVVADRREGRYIFYRLRDPALLGLVHQAALLQGLELPALAPAPDCGCPNCCEQRNSPKGCSSC